MTEHETDMIRDMQYNLKNARDERDVLEARHKDQMMKYTIEVEKLALECSKDPARKGELSNGQKRTVAVNELLAADVDYVMDEAALIEINEEIQMLVIELDFQGRQFSRGKIEAQQDLGRSNYETTKLQKEVMKMIQEDKI